MSLHFRLLIFINTYMMCIYASQTSTNKDDPFNVTVVNKRPGMIEVQWKFDGSQGHLDKKVFTLSYGIIDRGKGPEPKWALSRHVLCCQATVNKLPGHAFYGVKVSVELDNVVMTSPTQEVHVTRGVPYEPGDIRVKVDMQGNRTLLTWRQDYADYVDKYHVTIGMHDEVFEVNTMDTRWRLDAVPEVNETLQINVSAVNEYGHSNIVTTYFTYLGDSDNGEIEERDITPVVFIVPLIILLSLILLVAVITKFKRKSLLSKARRMSRCSNTAPKLPLKNIWLQEIKNSPQASPRNSFYDSEDEVTIFDPPARNKSQGRQYNIRFSRYQKLNSSEANQNQDNPTHSHSSKSYTFAWQQGDGSPYAAPRRSRPPSSYSSPESELQIIKPSAKLTPIIPISGEKWLGKVGNDPAGNQLLVDNDIDVSE